ncbi:MAG: competence/damage-inducible protein A [Candidatus Eisenbacteria bacterium]
MRFEIVTIGAELLDGTRVDTNTPEIASRLRRLGGQIARATSVPDEPDAIREAVSDALDRAGAVVVTGGLGATSDDRTKHVVARLFGGSLVLDEDVLAQIRGRFEKLGLPMPELNVSQAMIPEGARAIPNTLGTAPGLVLSDERGIVFLLPGVPAEMTAMLESYVVPFLEGRGLRRELEERVLKTTGISESALAGIVDPLVRRLARTDVSYLPSLEGVIVRLHCSGAGLRDASRNADRSVERVADALGSFVYARDDQSLEEITGYLLTMERRSVAVAESCTGGLLGWRLTSVPGSSDYVKGGVVAYSNDLKRRLLGVRAGTLKAHGAVSREVAEEMAEGARAKCRADYGVSVTGVAGPDGGTDEKPVGLVWIAVASPSGHRARRLLFGGPRETVRAMAAQAALELLRRTLLGLPDEG